MTGNVLPISIFICYGVLIIIALWPEAVFDFRTLFIAFIIGGGAGFGLSSVIYFIWLWVTNQNSSIMYLMVIEYTFMLVLLSLTLLRVWEYWRRNKPTFNISKNFSWELMFLTGFGILGLFISLSRFINRVIMIPHGDWDAWAIWNLHARFLFRGGQQWSSLFSDVLYWSHPDYPLLLPAGIARIWTLIGRERLITPILVTGGFTYASAFLLFMAIWKFKGIRQGLVAGTVLLLTPMFINQGSSQLADIPLGFYNLASCVLIFLFYQQRTDHVLLILVGIFLGLSIWTKNEGWSFLIAAFLAVCIFDERAKGWQSIFTKWGYMLIGLLPFITIVLLFKVFFASPNDIFDGQSVGNFVGRLMDINRYKQTLISFSSSFIRFGDWKLSLLPLLIILSIFIGISIPQKVIPAIKIVSAILVLVIFQYFLIYIITPRDLTWHLTTLNRILFHVFPSFLFVYFVLIRTLSGNTK